MSPYIRRRDFLATLSLATSACALPSYAHGPEHKPNVLLIMTDDQGWGDIHSHGNDVLQTPVLDSLAESGARFEHFYVSPVCAPTRASLLTGRYHLRTGVHGVTRGYETMRSEEETLAECFKKAGYSTGCFGKWHNGAHYPYHPNAQGFDEFYGFCAGHWNNYFDTHLEHNGQEVETQGYITDVLTDQAIEFIQSQKEQPFFCYVPYNAPHSPWQVPDSYFEKYKSKGLDDETACAYAMCENLDDNIGRLLKTLDKLDLAQDTIVLFLTDNGPNGDRYNGGMKGRKGSVDEGGIRVPLFVRWPGHIAKGHVVRPIAAHIDLLPTLAELCDLPLEANRHIDGISIAPLLLGEPLNWPDRRLFTHWGRRGSVRTEHWRAVKQNRDWELYNIQADPAQKKDVAEQHSTIVQELSESYEEWFEDVSRGGLDPIPIPIGYQERPEVVMPGHEAFLYDPNEKGIRYNGNAGWANDWITGWKDVKAFPFWEVEVVQPGTYELVLMYACKPQDVGAKFSVEIAGKKLQAEIQEPHDPDFLPRPDRVPRKEVYEREWKPHPLGKMELPAGRTQLKVHALEKPGETVMELKAVRVRRVE